MTTPENPESSRKVVTEIFVGDPGDKNTGMLVTRRTVTNLNPDGTPMIKDPTKPEKLQPDAPGTITITRYEVDPENKISGMRVKNVTVTRKE